MHSVLIKGGVLISGVVLIEGFKLIHNLKPSLLVLVVILFWWSKMFGRKCMLVPGQYCVNFLGAFSDGPCWLI